MSEDRFENVMRELREAAPPAPESLRGRIQSLPMAQPRPALRLRPALSAAIAIAIAVSLGAAVIGGFTGSGTGTGGGDFAARDAASELAAPKPSARSSAGKAWNGVRALDRSTPLGKFDPVITPGSRLQQYGVTMSLRVRDLSGSTQAAVRQTRRLGGYVAAANYATGSNTGDSSLDLRVPVQNVQEAIAKFTDLGTILSQRISVADLQAPLDRTDARIAAARKTIAELEAKRIRTPDEQLRLEDAKRTLKRLTQTRSNIVREGTYAKISLQLTTRKEATQHTEPGRFDRFWGDAGDILGKEAIGVLYVLVIVGPFAILAALALLAERARRRRADHRLLGETG
jgi:hypothetical protein